MSKGNVNFVGFAGVIVLLSTLILPQVVMIEGVETPELTGTILGVISFILSSIAVMVKISLALPVLGFFYVPLTASLLYVLFKDVVPPLISGIFSNTITGVAAGLAVGITFLIALVALLL